MAKRRKQKRGRRRPAHHARKRHALPFNFVSGFIYAGAAIACISLGALLYKGVKQAEKDLQPKSAATAKRHGYLPPGARVVKKRGATSERDTEIPPPRKRVVQRRRLQDVSTESEKTHQKQHAAPREPEQLDLPKADAGRKNGKDNVLTPRHRPMTNWEPAVYEIRNPQHVTLSPSSDTTVFLAGSPYQKYNAGAEEEVMIMGNASVALVQYDLEPVRGWTIRRATWHAKVKRGQARELGFSSLPATWAEGKGTLESPAQEGATYAWADADDTPWHKSKAPLAAITRGNGYSLFHTSLPDKQGSQSNEWISLEIDPVLVQALIAGASEGIVISDEKGQITRQPIRFASRETADSHYIEVEGQLLDLKQPGRIEAFRAHDHPDLHRRDGVGALLTWKAAGDDGDEGQAFRYDIRYTAHEMPFASASRVPLAETPFPPRKTGKRDQVVIENLDPNTTYTFFIRAFDEAGQAGPIAETTFTTAARLALPEPPEPDKYPVQSLELLGRTVQLQVGGEYAGIDPYRGAYIAQRDDSGARAKESYIWERDARSLHLRACRNESIGFIMMLGRTGNAFPSIDISATPLTNTRDEQLAAPLEFSRVMYQYKRSEQGRREVIGDALLPMALHKISPEEKSKLARQRSQALYGEITVPPDATPDLYQSTITLKTDGGEESTLSVFLNVLPVRLPEQPRFTIELVGTPGLAALYRKDVLATTDALPIEKAYHAMARTHRAVFSIIPYSSSGECPPPFTPMIAGQGLDTKVTSWGAWSERFEPFLAGSAYDTGRPVHHFILPLFENWPSPLEKYYRCAAEDVVDPASRTKHYAGPSSKITQCLDHDYWRAFRAITEEFGEHFAGRSWNATTAHVLFDNTPTNTYKGRAPSWSLGQPVYRDDFVALEAYARMFGEDGLYWPGKAPLFRINIPDIFALQRYGTGLFDLLCVANPDTSAWQTLQQRREAYDEQLWLSTPSLPIEKTQLDIAASGVGRFLDHADGWTIRNVIGTRKDWIRPRPDSLLYCGAPWRKEFPYASLRLKALRRVQQDIDLLWMLQEKRGWTREQLRDFVEARLPYNTTIETANCNDLYALRYAAQDLLAAP